MNVDGMLFSQSIDEIPILNSPYFGVFTLSLLVHIVAINDKVYFNWPVNQDPHPAHSNLTLGDERKVRIRGIYFQE